MFSSPWIDTKHELCNLRSEIAFVNIDHVCSYVQPKWNNALLEMFRIDYVGRLPYISCQPCLYHHRLGPKDRFLILSSDGLYQYFTNEEAVSEVELFITLHPEGDPAQHLIELLLFRAAKRAGKHTLFSSLRNMNADIIRNA